jgi:hypothetical protein
MMGCCCLRLEDLVRSFTEKGASTFITWDGGVHLDCADDAAPVLVERLCSDELSVAKAVDITMREKGPDPEYRAVLRYYPPRTVGRTLKQLIE